MELAAECRTACAGAADADGDGHAAEACGGDDCDDADPDRYPGNTERCDAIGHDEDCDALTLGGPSDADIDADGFVSVECCNQQVGGALRCGLDCDDARPSVLPGGTEVCNGDDDDCDGALDEGVLATQYLDLDGDGFGNPRTASTRACGDPLYVEDNGDCDDGDAAVYPGASEICDGKDNDCDGGANDEVDADADDHLHPSSGCVGGPLPKDDCDDANPTVHPLADDVCNDRDDDCDELVDERVESDALCASGALNAHAICAYGGDAVRGNRCVITACQPGFEDCDQRAANGCETSVGTVENCGACGHRCQTGECVNERCVDEVFHATYMNASGRDDGLCAHDGDRAICWGYSLGRTPRFLDEDDGSVARGIVDSFGSVSGVCALSSGGAYRCRGVRQPAWGAGESGPALSTAWVDGPGQDFATVRATETHGCGLDQEGRVWCWGYPPGNGRSDVTWTANEVTVPGAPITELAVANETTCALHNDGAVSCWGDYNGAALSTHVPARVGLQGGGAFVADAIFGGVRHLCAVSSGVPYCWGDAGAWLGVGRMDAGAARFPAPAGVVFSSPIVELSLNADTTCARGESGTIRCFGSGPLGDGSVGSSVGDDVVTWTRDNLRALSAVSLGSNGLAHCAVDADGAPYCWGYSPAAGPNLAHPRVASFGYALPIPTPALPLSLSVSRRMGCTVMDDGTSRCWGALWNYGVEGSTRFRAETPRLVDWGGPVRQVSVGEEVVCAIVRDGEVYCRGGLEATEPPVAGGTLTGTAVPSRIPLPARAIQIDTSYDASCAVLEDGRVMCWGQDRRGALGDGDSSLPECGGECTTAPVAVVGLPPDDPAVEVSLFAQSVYANVCVRLASGRVYCWGSGTFGTIGDGRSEPRAAPSTPALGVEDAVGLSTHFLTTCVVRAGGQVMCWGSGALGYPAPEFCGIVGCSATPRPVRGVFEATGGFGRGGGGLRPRAGR